MNEWGKEKRNERGGRKKKRKKEKEGEIEKKK